MASRANVNEVFDEFIEISSDEDGHPHGHELQSVRRGPPVSSLELTTAGSSGADVTDLERRAPDPNTQAAPVLTYTTHFAEAGPARPLAGGISVDERSDLILIPDEESASPQPRNSATRLPNPGSHAQNQGVTVETCLQHVIELFPDVDPDHIRTLYNNFDRDAEYEVLPGAARQDNIIEELLSGSNYPKRTKGKEKLKRKRESESLSDTANEVELDLKWRNTNRAELDRYQLAYAVTAVRVEMVTLPRNAIQEAFIKHTHLYPTYLSIAESMNNTDLTALVDRTRIMLSQPRRDRLAVMLSFWPGLAEELTAARKRIARLKAERDEAESERRNKEAAIASGSVVECCACYDDIPTNRQIFCSGRVPHYTCCNCVVKYIETLIGDSRCNLTCPAGCGAVFAASQLDRLGNKPLLEKLARLQQGKEILDAGLDDLEECPFCDYKAVVPPVEEDFEFRCANPECEKVSCRRCRKVSHVPLSCGEFASTNRDHSRHKLEEAMTAAMVRMCNKCKNQFIKEFGCNKMRCPTCGNVQCYVCSKSLTNYGHFSEGQAWQVAGQQSSSSRTETPEKCPLYDDVEVRHEREVKDAAAVTRAQIISENPHLQPEDLEIKVSDAVERASNTRDARLDRIREAHAGFAAAREGCILDLMARRPHAHAAMEHIPNHELRFPGYPMIPLENAYLARANVVHDAGREGQDPRRTRAIIANGGLPLPHAVEEALQELEEHANPDPIPDLPGPRFHAPDPLPALWRSAYDADEHPLPMPVHNGNPPPPPPIYWRTGGYVVDNQPCRAQAPLDQNVPGSAENPYITYQHNQETQANAQQAAQPNAAPPPVRRGLRAALVQRRTRRRLRNSQLHQDLPRVFEDVAPNPWEGVDHMEHIQNTFTGQNAQLAPQYSWTQQDQNTQQPPRHPWEQQNQSTQQALQNLFEQHDQSMQQPLRYPWEQQDQNTRQPPRLPWHQHDHGTQQPPQNPFQQHDHSTQQPLHYPFEQHDHSTQHPPQNPFEQQHQSARQPLLHPWDQDDQNPQLHQQPPQSAHPHFSVARDVDDELRQLLQDTDQMDLDLIATPAQQHSQNGPQRRQHPLPPWRDEPN